MDAFSFKVTRRGRKVATWSCRKCLVRLCSKLSARYVCIGGYWEFGQDWHHDVVDENFWEGWVIFIISWGCYRSRLIRSKTCPLFFSPVEHEPALLLEQRSWQGGFVVAGWDRYIRGVTESLRSWTCGCKGLIFLGDHVSTCTVHSGATKTHDWTVEKITDLFRTTHKVKTQQVTKNRGQWCGDIELDSYLIDVPGPVPLVLDLHKQHMRVGEDDQLQYPPPAQTCWHR